MYSLHTIAAKDLENLTTDSVIAFFDNKELRACFSASQTPKVSYHVLERGGATESTVIHTYSDFESAVAKYNEL